MIQASITFNANMFSMYHNKDIQLEGQILFRYKICQHIIKKNNEVLYNAFSLFNTSGFAPRESQICTI